MIKKTMKHAAVLAAALALPTSAMAARASPAGEPVKLDDAELDQVSAGALLDLGGLVQNLGQTLGGILGSNLGSNLNLLGTGVGATSGLLNSLTPLLQSVTALTGQSIGQAQTLSSAQSATGH
jgi:hypothetical protein